MTVGTVGTSAPTSLTSLQFQPNMTPADLATINADILEDNNPTNATVPQSKGNALNTSGMLKLPGGRGIIQLLPGDYVAVDPVTGWPIVVSANCIAAGAYSHTH